MKIYDITLSITDSESFRVEKSVGISGTSLIEVISKMQFELVKFMQADFERQLKEQLVLHNTVDDDIPF